MTFEKKIDEYLLKENYSFSKEERVFCIHKHKEGIGYDKIAEVRFEKGQKENIEHDLFYLRIIARKFDSDPEEEAEAFRKAFPVLKAWAEEELSYSYLFVSKHFLNGEGEIVEERFYDLFEYIPSDFKQFRSSETKEIDFFLEIIEKTKVFFQEIKKQEPRIDFYKQDTAEFFLYIPSMKIRMVFSYEAPHVVLRTYEQDQKHEIFIDETTAIAVVLQEWFHHFVQKNRLKRLFGEETYHQEKWKLHLRVDADLILDFLKARHTNEEIEVMLAIERTRREESGDQKLDFEIHLFDKEYFLVSVERYHFLIKKGIKIIQPAFRNMKEDEIVHYFESDEKRQVERHLQDFLEKEATKRIQEEMKRFAFHCQKEKKE